MGFARAAVEALFEQADFGFEVGEALLEFGFAVPQAGGRVGLGLGGVLLEVGFAQGGAAGGGAVGVGLLAGGRGGRGAGGGAPRGGGAAGGGGGGERGGGGQGSGAEGRWVGEKGGGGGGQEGSSGQTRKPPLPERTASDECLPATVAEWLAEWSGAGARVAPASRAGPFARC